MQNDSQLADLIFHGGEIVTVDDSCPTAEAVAVKNGDIIKVGSRAEVMEHAGPETNLIDLAGRALLPGFVEPHGHPLLSSYARGTPVVDVRAINSPTFEAVMQVVRRRVAKATPGEWLHFLGLDPQLHTDMHEPTIQELTAIAPQNPLTIQTSNFHVIYANSAAFERRGWSKATTAPDGGEIYLDASGELTGKVAERAIEILNPFFEARGLEGNKAAFNEWIWKHVRAGITTGTEIGLRPYMIDVYRDYAKKPDPLMRIFAYDAVNAQGVSRCEPGEGNEFFKVIGIKTIADGSPFVGNIFISKPYLNTELTLQRMGLPENNTGHTNWTEQQLSEALPKYVAAGWQLATHTQGDRAVDMILDLYEKVLAAHPRADHRFRLEHCAMLRDDQVDRAMRLGVVCSFFPAHLYFWGEPIADHMFGPDVAAHYMPFASAARAGMRFSLHADSPMTDPAPLLCMQIATTRRTKAGRVLGAEQCVSREQALRAVTIDAAYQLFMDDRVGSVTVGKSADFVVLAENPLSAESERLSEIKVHGTWLAGRQVFWED